MSQTEDIPVVEEQVKEVDHPEGEVQPEQVDQEEIPTKDESHDQETPKPKPKPKKKSVGFAPPPEEDLKEHHQVIKEKEAERAKSHPFHKIPPELAYLEKRDHKLDPKPLGKPAPAAVTSKPYSMPPLKTLKYIDIKALGVVNKATELQFHYSGIELPPAAGSMVVDVKYGGLNNLDIAKLNQYVLNLSDVKVGIGYEFSGIVSQVGAGVSFVPGDIVYGLISPDARRGALCTNQIIYPNRDVVIKVDKETLSKLNDVNIKICFDDNKSFQVEDDDAVAAEEEEEQVGQQSSDLDSLWKLSAFPTVVNRAEQLIRHLKPKNGRANVLINGGDTNVGLTITQLLFAEYNLENLNLILIIRESSQKFMDQFVTHIQEKFKDPATTKRITCIPFDLVNDDLYFPGEKIPINYKKPDFFAAEVINALLYEPVDQTNINDYKLDILVDLIGCKKFFQYTKTKLNEISTIRFPFQENIQSSSLEKLFNGKVSEPFLVKILKPKKFGSSLVSGCNFYLSNPSYNIDELINVQETSILNPWNSSWSSNLLNNWTTYNYHEEINFAIKREWCERGLDLVLKNQLKFKIDDVTEWKNYKKKEVRTNDAKLVLKVEDF